MNRGVWHGAGAGVGRPVAEDRESERIDRARFESDALHQYCYLSPMRKHRWALFPTGSSSRTHCVYCGAPV